MIADEIFGEILLGHANTMHHLQTMSDIQSFQMLLDDYRNDEASDGASSYGRTSDIGSMRHSVNSGYSKSASKRHMSQRSRSSRITTSEVMNNFKFNVSAKDA